MLPPSSGQEIKMRVLYEYPAEEIVLKLRERK